MSRGKKASVEDVAAARGIRERIRQACREQGVTMKEVAAACGVAPGYFCPSVTSEIPPQRLCQVADWLNVSTGWLATGEGAMLPVGDGTNGTEGTNEGGAHQGARAAKEAGEKLTRRHEGTKEGGDGTDTPMAELANQEPVSLVDAAAAVMRSARALERALADLNRIAAGILEEVGQ